MKESKTANIPAFRPRGRRFGHGGTIESPLDFKKALTRLLAYIGPQTIVFLITAILILIDVVLRVAAPAIIGRAITRYLETTQNLSKFIEQMIVLLIIYGVSWAVNALYNALIVRIGNNIVFRLRNDLFRHIQTLSMSYFDKRGIGDIISRLTNDIEMIYNALSNGISQMISGLFSVIGVIIGMLMLNIQLSLVVISVVPVMFIVTGIIGKRIRAAFRINQQKIGELSANIQESVTGVKVIQSFHREKEEYNKFEKINDSTRRAGVKAQFTAYIFMPLMNLLTALVLSLLVGIGGFLIMGGNSLFSIGLLTSFIIYARRFFEPLRQMTGVYNVIQSALAGAERVFDVLETSSDIESVKNAKKIETIEGTVRFENVTFGYTDDKTVLENINLNVSKGQIIAIVGPTGAGKTTLVNLLSRFYDVTEGDIFIDNIPIKQIDVNSLRTKMGVVLQEPFFFAVSIRENLKYGNPDATDKQIEEAAIIANAHHFIQKLPEGYDTILSERGLNLSQGERQLLAITRAILANPKILILDEATSNIDSLTEANIQEALLTLMKGRTSFIIAHRLSTIRNADNVIVLHNRSVVEQGTHDELMMKKGFYYRLYMMQRTKAEITEDMAI
ncbi:MAG: ABC transporter ATP-binding protein [Spirochaetales bacterium]|nr:ABC transporter ATP-binding protein [Spirochaetales bacterium]